MNDKELMTTGPIYSKILYFALNVLLGNLFQQLYNTVDSVIVGNYLGSNSLAAVSTAGNIVFLIIGLFVGISVGSGVVIANYIGAQRKEEISLSVHSSVAFGLASSIVLTVAGALLAPVILEAMNTPADVLGESITYFRIYFLGSAGFVMYNTFTGIMRAAGDSKRPLYYLIFSSVLNVVLDIAFVAGFGMGVDGAALATVIAQAASAVLALARLLRIDADYRIVPRKIRFDKGMTLKIVRFGVPTGIQNSVMAISNVVIQTYINSFGAYAMAGIGAYTKIEGFIFIPLNSFCMAISTFVGQNVGAKEYGRLRKGIRFGLICMVVSSFALGTVLMIFAEPLIGLFDSTPLVVEYGVGRAHVVSMLFFLCGVTHFMAAVIRGLGKPIATLLVYLICWCVVRVAIITIFGPVFDSIYLSHWVYPITWTLSSVALIIIYFRSDITKAGV